MIRDAKINHMNANYILLIQDKTVIYTNYYPTCTCDQALKKPNFDNFILSQFIIYNLAAVLVKSKIKNA